MSEMKIYIRSRIDAGLITVESDKELISPVILNSDGTPSPANMISSGSKDGKFTAVFDASGLKCWTPDTPVLYTLKADNAVEKFGYCELKTFSNTDILLNGERFYMRGYIRGIKAHEHPNMTGGSLKDAAVIKPASIRLRI